MNFMGGGATTGQEWLDFLGLVKDKRVPPVGSPFQLNFNPGGSSTPGVPPEIHPAEEALPGCGDPLFLCSCADCPPAPGCKAVRGNVTGWESERLGQKMGLQAAERAERVGWRACGGAGTLEIGSPITLKRNL